MTESADPSRISFPKSFANARTVLDYFQGISHPSSSLLFATFLVMSSAGWRDFAIAAPILAALAVAIDRTPVRADSPVPTGP